MSDEKMIEKAQADRLEFLRYLNDEKLHWEHCRNHKGISISRCLSLVEEQRKGHVFKGEALFNATMEHLVYLIHPCGPYRLQWDTHLLGIEVLKNLSPNVVLVHHMVKPQIMGIISKRDTVDLLSIDRTTENDWFISFSSVDCAECKPEHGFVRAWSYPSGIMLEATNDPAVTRVRCIFHADYNMPHLIPVSIMDATMPRELQHFFQRFRDAPKNTNFEKLKLPGWPC